MKRFPIILLLLLTTLQSCIRESSHIDNTSINCDSIVPQLILGKKLENPYSVTNMRKALNALDNNTKSDLIEPQNDIIYPTHLYIKFKPKSDDELSILKSDSTLVLYPYPLDYEIISYGEYHDPEVPLDQPTPMYAAIPFTNNYISAIDYEIIEELFIPDGGDIVATKGGRVMSEDFVNALVDKSLELTNNLDPETTNTKSKKNKKWHPQGIVRYYDDIKEDTLGIEGLQVRCQRWFTTHKAYTKADGSFYSDKTFNKPANYSIVFERYDFEIRSSWLSTAKYDGPQSSGYWDVNFTGNRLYTYYSTVFRAAYKYYYQNIHGLSRPPLNGTWKTQLKIKATKKEKGYLGYHSPALRFIGLGSAIHIYTLDESLTTTFATTIHELAHAAHWGLYKSDYNNATDFVLESWTRGVQVFLTQDVYPGYNCLYSTNSYTGLVRDLMDEKGLVKTAYSYYNTKTDEYEPYEQHKTYIDSVSGYTMPEVEKSLKGARTAEQWKNNFKTLYDNESEEHLDSTFDFWAHK